MVTDMPVVIDGKEFESFDDVFTNAENVLTAADNAEIEFNINFAGALIEAREKSGITQKQLAHLSGVKQPAISRIERGTISPSIDTFLKVVVPLGYKLALVPIDSNVGVDSPVEAV